MRLVEVVVALLLGTLLVVAVWRGAAAVRKDGARLHARAALRDAIRVTGLVLDVEASGFVGPAGRPGDLAVRAPRWWAVPCDPRPRVGGAAVAWRGLRRPDPAKDSVVLVSGDGFRWVRALDRVAPSTHCAPEGLDLRWTPAAGEPIPVVVQGFERGVYRVDDALRYRRGRGGAQPLTAALLDPDSARLVVDGAGVRLHVNPRPPRRWSW